ncbi:MAG: DNA-processing protein DprA [Anaerolineae bacterium]|nr:DNA-processing protein DprA [Anaerolineae bacterium]
MDSLAYWIGFNKARGIGPARLRALLDAFGNVEAAWNAPVDALRDVGLDRRSIQNLVELRGRCDLEAELARIRKAGVDVLTWDDPRYPARLKAIGDSPPVIYLRGDLRPEDDFGVAVVGTRGLSNYGREAARSIAEGLAAAGVTVISGLARGIDAVAHRAALDAGGRTLAVLGCGVDVVYPWENRHLAADVIQRGALISEYPLGTQPEATNFPPRNRIVSGLSRGVVVIEAGEQSGALITARFAADQGRDVFAVPGSIFARNSAGTHRLLRDGATPVTSVNDILEALNLERVEEHVQAQMVFPADPVEAKLLEQLGDEPVHVDELCRATGLPIATVTATLALMELKGMVRGAGGMSYVRGR